MHTIDYTTLRGFNYMPSYGSSGLEVWNSFDEKILSYEVALGKLHFPGITALRWWLSYDAWQRNPTAFLAKFEKTLDIADRNGLVVMPVLFNRWHCGTMDYGGVYFESLSGRLWEKSETHPHREYMKQIIGAHARDPRIFSWDLCNEPFGATARRIPQGIEMELGWLTSLYGMCKEFGAQAPVTVGIHMEARAEQLRMVEPISDVFSIHPYHIPGAVEKADMETFLDDCVSFTAQVKKPLIASETCWGNVDDHARAKAVAYHLEQLKARGIGWLAYGLHHSLCPDLHGPDYGPIGIAGNCSFLNPDGRMRPGHEIFNDF